LMTSRCYSPVALIQVMADLKYPHGSLFDDLLLQRDIDL
jgi:hypothetical protein